MPSTRSGLGWALALLALVLVACSGSDPLSSEELVTEAQAICTEATADILAFGTRTADEITNPDDPQAMADYFENVAGVVERSRSDLADLDVSEADEPAMRRFLDRVDDWLSLVDEFVVALRAEDLSGFEDVVGRGVSVERDLELLSSEAGYPRCGLLQIP